MTLESEESKTIRRAADFAAHAAVQRFAETFASMLRAEAEHMLQRLERSFPAGITYNDSHPDVKVPKALQRIADMALDAAGVRS